MNKSESKVPVPFLNYYMDIVRGSGRVLKKLSKTSNDWTIPEEIRDAVRVQTELSKQKTKAAYDRHRHDNAH